MTNYKFALIGYPLGHTLSPFIHEKLLKDLGLEGSYEAIPTKSEDLISKIKYLRANKYFGFNVTIPHKVPVVLFLSKYDEYVNMTGSVNTIKIEEDMSLSGYNTDVYGFIKAIPNDIDLKGKKAVILGTGGASRAVCAGLYSLGVSKFDIYTRNIINSKEAVDTLRKKFDKAQITAIQNSLMEGLEDVDILVNTTPLGMKDFMEDACIVDNKNMESLKDSALVYDIVYNPIRTPLISKAIKFNKRYVIGLDMLIHQAIGSFEIWTGQKGDFQAVKAALLEDFLINQ